jgi:hypothetical protein
MKTPVCNVRSGVNRRVAQGVTRMSASAMALFTPGNASFTSARIARARLRFEQINAVAVVDDSNHPSRRDRCVACVVRRVYADTFTP